MIETRYRNFKSEFRYKYARKFMKGGTILDIGCGNGRSLGFLNDFKIVGVNCEDDYTNDAREYNKEYKNMKFFTMKVPPLKFKADMFDNVILSEVFEHLPVKDAPNVIKEIYRVLKKGGILYLTTPNANNQHNKFHFYKNEQLYDSNIHQKEYTPEELKEIVEKAGFKIVRASGYYIPVLVEQNKRTKISSKIVDTGLNEKKFIRFFIRLVWDFQNWLGTVFPSKAYYQVIVCKK